MENKKDGLNVVTGDLHTQDARQEVEKDLKLEPKKENTTVQDLKEYLMEDKADSLNVVKDDVKVVKQEAMQEENELKLDESKKEEKEEVGLGVIKDVTIGRSNSLLAMVRDNHL